MRVVDVCLDIPGSTANIKDRASSNSNSISTNFLAEYVMQLEMPWDASVWLELQARGSTSRLGNPLPLGCDIAQWEETC